MSFTIRHADEASAARTGFLALNHGTVSTPCFMPVGTNATVKAMKNGDLEEMGFNLILGNTYHLYLRPGKEVIQKAGGLHQFMGWNRNILTDSGGYQVFSLAPLRVITEEGIRFKSHIDGSAHSLSPEDVIEIQNIFGSDIMMPLDVCTPPGIPRTQAREALQRTAAWLRRSKKAWQETGAGEKGTLFGIVQGNFYEDLRAESAEKTVDIDLPGYAIGGLSVGESFDVFKNHLRFTAEKLPADKPRYLMGIGTPPYILEAVEAGIDLFDCAFPTRTARNALVFTSTGPLSLRTEKNRLDFSPIDPECRCETCRVHTRAYLRHLFKAKEIQAAVLATCHNLFFIQNFIKDIRKAIDSGVFKAFKKEYLSRFDSSQAAGNSVE